MPFFYTGDGFDSKPPMKQSKEQLMNSFKSDWIQPISFQHHPKLYFKAPDPGAKLAAKHCKAMSHESALTSNLFWHFRSWCARRPSWTWNQSILGYFSATGWNLERVCLQHSRKELATSLAHLTNFCVRIVL